MEGEGGGVTFEFDDGPHGLVDCYEGFLLAGLVFLLDEGEANGDDQVGPSPEGEVASECHQANVRGDGAEPFVGKVGGVEGEEDGKGEELTGCESNGLCGRGVREVVLREERNGPAY